MHANSFDELKILKSTPLKGSPVGKSSPKISPKTSPKVRKLRPKESPILIDETEEKSTMDIQEPKPLTPNPETVLNFSNENLTPFELDLDPFDTEHIKSDHKRPLKETIPSKRKDNPNDFIPEILNIILSYFTCTERIKFDLVSYNWHKSVSDESFWKRKCETEGIRTSPNEKARLIPIYKSFYFFYKTSRCQYCFKPCSEYRAFGVCAHYNCIRYLTTFKSYSEKFYLLDEEDYHKLRYEWVNSRVKAPCKMYLLSDVEEYAIKKYGSKDIIYELRQLKTKKQREKRLAEIRGEIPEKKKKVKKVKYESDNSE